MTPQEFFDVTVNHIRAQGGPSVDVDGRCAYRGDIGRKCAAGVHITDGEYMPEMEGNLEDIFRREFLPETHVLNQHMGLAGALQAAHDESSIYSGQFFMSAFEAQARISASLYSLTYTEPA